MKLLGEHEEESCQKIMELKALCKKLREDTKKLEEEKATLKEWSSLAMSSSWRSPWRMDLTAWEKMLRMKRKMRMLTTEKMPLHPLLPHMRRSTMKALWRWFLNKKLLWTTMRRTTKMSTRHHPLHLLLSKCWLCKHKCFRPCSRPWSTCKLLSLKRHHHRRGISLEIFHALSSLPFSHTVEPMDANNWLKSFDKKLQVVRCNNREKVLLAFHQLSSLAAGWWVAYLEAHEEPESINWP
jgi:hypothetical protein